MPRKKLVRSKVHPYHVTLRANNREEFHLPLETVWKMVTYHCHEASVLWKARIHALVLMPNHLHLLISTPEADLGTVMEHFVRGLTKYMNLKSDRSGRVFGGPYHWTLIDSETYFACAIKYVYRNPVRANICDQVEAYPFSTLQNQIGSSKPLVPLSYPFGLDYYPAAPSGFDHWLKWLNSPFGNESEAIIQKNLQKTIFKPSLKQWRKLSRGP